MSRGFGVTYGVATSDVVNMENRSTPTQATYFCWVYPNTFPAYAERIYDNGVVTLNTLIFYNSTSVKMSFGSAFSTTNGTFEWPLPTVNAWTPLFLSYDTSSTANVPVVIQNGIAQTVTTITPPVGTGDANTGVNQIGNRNAGQGGANRAWDGLLAHFAQWNTILTPHDAHLLSNGVNPLLVRPEHLVYHFPLNGYTSPEINLAGGRFSTTTTGTKAGTLEAPVIPLYAVRKFFDYLGPSASTFQAAWAARQGAVIGGGVYV